MSWNYRLMAKEFPCGTVEFDIYEVYYNENGVANATSKESVSPGGYTTVIEVKDSLELMLKALDKPILWYNEDKFPQEYKE